MISLNDTMTLTEVSSERCFRVDADTTVYLKVMQPSEQHGFWVGNMVTIRKWKIWCKENGSAINRCTQKQVRMLEKILGEIEEVAFFNHPGCGEVAYDIKDHAKLTGI